jgi:YbbR domain-containing protein
LKFSLRNILFNNLSYKIAAIFLAIVLWYIVQGEEILEINRKIRVHLDIPEQFIIKGGPVRFKDATLSGPRVLLSEFSSDYIDAHIPISIDHPASLRFRIDKEFIKRWNNRIKLTVHDAYLSVDVDAKIQKLLPVKENIQGLPLDGYAVEKITVHPARISVLGAKSDLLTLPQIMTESIDISGLQKSKSFDVSLLSNNLDIQFLTDRVTVQEQIGEKKFNKHFSAIPIQSHGSEFNTHIFPETLSLTLQGTTAILDVIQDKDFSATLDLRDLLPGVYQKQVQLKIPPDTVLVDSHPENITVEIFNKKKK